MQLFHLPFAGAVVFPETQIEETLPPVETSAPDQSVGSPTIAAPVSDGVAVDHSALAAPNAPAVPSAPKAPALTRIPAWLGWAWLAGSVAVALVLLACNLRFSQKLRRVRLPLKDADCSLPVYVAVGLPSPCLFGVVRPAVYITPVVATNPILLRHVLAHETTHFHHEDHLWNVLRNIALAIHWWNPLVWLAVILSRRDCELACDEGALKRLDAGERIAYGRTLLALVTEKPRASDLFTCATTMTGNQKGVIERVNRIARTPKRWLWAAVVLVLTISLACVCAFGSAAEQSDEAAIDSTLAPTRNLNFEEQGLDFVMLNEFVLYDAEVPLAPDLNRNGVPETVIIGDLYLKEDADRVRNEGAEIDAMQRGVEVWEGDERLWIGMASYIHAGNTSFLLYSEDGEDYLMEFNIYGQQGQARGCYRVFTLENGKETTVRENHVEFDYCTDSLASVEENFDPEKVAAFVDEVDGLLNQCTLLIDTGENYRYDPLRVDITWLEHYAVGAAAEKAVAPSSSATSNRYLTVIQENELLYSPEHGKRMTLDELCSETGPGYAIAGISDFSVLDLDGDGAQEVVLNLDRTYRQWCVVLHEQGGEVRGYAFYIRWLNTYTLKEDGAFDWSSGAFENGWGKLCFTEDGYETENTIWHMDTTYYLGDQAVSQVDYDAAYNRQEAVPNTAWYDFTQENIAAAFPV